jgi:hypothetical protein
MCELVVRMEPEGEGKRKEGKNLLFVKVRRRRRRAVKKKQKNFFSPLCQRWGSQIETRRDQGGKSFFGSFFSKKELLAFLPLALTPR